ncbi:hypothetical protein [Panacagrimonas sp.]|uniref:hypothetical protein n=1 Tax=Panacagrimonas sp. TaxID=2480088 RepID=UPI003B5175BE
MAAVARNLFESATGRGRVLRQGDLACIVMDGHGAVVVPTQDLVQVQKWAQSRPPSSNLLSDRARFLDQFQVLVSRPGSIQGTRGSSRPLERLVRTMLAAGYDLGEWTLPVEFRDLGKAKTADATAAASPTAQADSPTTPDPGTGAE